TSPASPSITLRGPPPPRRMRSRRKPPAHILQCRAALRLLLSARPPPVPSFHPACPACSACPACPACPARPARLRARPRAVTVALSLLLPSASICHQPCAIGHVPSAIGPVPSAIAPPLLPAHALGLRASPGVPPPPRRFCPRP